MKYSECFGLYPEGMGGGIQKVLERSAYRMEKEWEEEWGSGGGGVGVGWAEMGQEAHYACFSHWEVRWRWPELKVSEERRNKHLDLHDIKIANL